MANRRCFKATRRKQQSEEELHNFLQGQEVLNAHILPLHVHQPSEFTPLLEMQRPETCTTWHFHHYLYYKHYNPLDSLAHVPCGWAFLFALWRRGTALKNAVSWPVPWLSGNLEEPRDQRCTWPANHFLSEYVLLTHQIFCYKAILTEDKSPEQNKVPIWSIMQQN